MSRLRGLAHPSKNCLYWGPLLWIPLSPRSQIHMELGEFSFSEEQGSTQGGVGWSHLSSPPDLSSVSPGGPSLHKPHGRWHQKAQAPTTHPGCPPSLWVPP